MNIQAMNEKNYPLQEQIKEIWELLTDEDIALIEESIDELEGILQRTYSISKERAQIEFNKFKINNLQYFRDNRESNSQEDIMTSTQYSGQLDSNKMKTRVQHMIDEDIVEPAQQYIAKARELSSKAVEKGSDIVRENPGYSILGAAAVGFLAGAYFSRRK